MRTWLLTWNSESWECRKEKMNEIEQVACTYQKWNCGKNRSIQKEDRIFLMKLKQFPKGIIASGKAMSSVFEQDGIHYIYVCFDRIDDYETQDILNLNECKKISSNFNWLSKSSGIQIPYEIAQSLEKKWLELDSIHFLHSFGMEFVQEKTSFSHFKDISSLLLKYGFEQETETEKAISYRNNVMNETIYSLKTDTYNLVIHPDIFMKGYNGCMHYNSDLKRFPETNSIHYGIQYEFEHEFEMEMFLSAFTNQLISIQNKKIWIVSMNPNVFNHMGCLKKYKTLTSRQFFNFEVGDIVLVYSSWPIQRIVALCIVTQINLSSCDLYEEFWYSKTESIRNQKYSRFFQMELIHFVNNDLLTYTCLKEHGLKNAPQSAMKLNQELYEYIFEEVGI
ncbi:MAG: hypothetical protein PUK65_00045 [Floccifex porci]|uniref:Uncharacterized protein n=1 Tax=Floccifex porci TaxID=2606629 RepID=A0A7X2N437_9FIRM|nr:hypothetical protein [Floccifex porci]MCI7803342.1 hypothetical protein [Erysipelotrichaceae bacterium]MDD7466218.1 hypothetical protein [Floccifex porci]MSS02129.1 hypothetical protein [Floccifex porci]